MDARAAGHASSAREPHRPYRMTSLLAGGILSVGEVNPHLRRARKARRIAGAGGEARVPSPTKKQLAYLLAFDGLAIQLVGLAIGLGAVGGGNALGFGVTGVGLTIFVVSLAVAGETSDQ